MKIIEISVTDREADRIAELGSKPWTQITDREKAEYESFIRLLGTQAALKIQKSEWRTE